MGFWGVEVKPGKPYPYHSDNVRGRLHITQATLGAGTAGKSILQCSIGHKSPVYLCSLLADKNECCPLNLVFEDDEVVAFSVVGSRSIHLSGYFESEEGNNIGDQYETDSDGEDIAETESDDSSEYDSEDDYADDFIDDDEDDFVLLPSSPAPKSGVVIEEIVDDEKPEKARKSNKAKKNQSSDDESNKKQIVKAGSEVPVLESEDEDGFPISKSKAKDEAETVNKKRDVENDSDMAHGKKRKVKVIEREEKSQRKQKKKKEQKRNSEGVNIEDTCRETKEPEDEVNKIEEEKDIGVKQVASSQNKDIGIQNDDKVVDKSVGTAPSDNLSDKRKKNKKKKNKSKAAEGDTDTDKTITGNGDEKKASIKPEEELATTKSSHVREHPNGLVVEELAMGKPDGKRASPGKQVAVRYIGKLKKNGKIFDSNVGGPPLKFRLGLGQVIKGWDVGVNGMRIGDKRRLTIPPSMGYGSRGAGGKIPPNAWLVFDVELTDVR